MPSKKTATVPAIERIREIAYQLWLDAGQPHGHDTAHWLEAESLASGELAQRGVAAARKTAQRRKAA